MLKHKENWVDRTKKWPATSYDSGEESQAAVASPTSVLRSFPQSTINITDTTKKPSTAPRVRETGETDESSDVFGCSFSDEGFAGEFPPLYTDFDLLADFPEPLLDFLSNLPEEPFTLAPFSTSASPDLLPDATSQAAAQVDDFFQDITDLFQLGVGRMWRYGWLLRSASLSRRGEDTALWRASRSRGRPFGDGCSATEVIGIDSLRGCDSAIRTDCIKVNPEAFVKEILEEEENDEEAEKSNLKVRAPAWSRESKPKL
ncbi:hypothetical protein GUJ93_ZPchr0004g40364 [Zizania palustris]|uniref:Uncharacterized protein n=1 Tax=Zizania palustris TaxID=103762 RepID=A0A8J5S1E1_ZIZPA|nr:hypothetical protein GUJ93_ZPchr0004g40364 [Zizania palustris]